MWWTILAGTGSCTLEIFSPSHLKDRLGQVRYSIANFGDIPFGKTIVGPLVVEQSDACDYETIKSVPRYHNAIVLVLRGGCTFVTKVMNAQKHGAKLVLIEDDQPHNYAVKMIDDGEGYFLHTPSLFIGYQDGQNLRKLSRSGGPLWLKVMFFMPRADKSHVSLVLDMSDRMSYVVAEEVYKAYLKLGELMTLQAHYQLVAMDATYDYKSSNCYGDGQYCVYTDKQLHHSNGQKALLEIIRQRLILADEGVEKYLKYMVAFNQHCTIDQAKQADCSQQMCKKVGIDHQKIERKLTSSFDGPITSSTSKSSQLQKIIDESAGISFEGSPTILVNNVTFSGKINAENIQEQICSGLAHYPSACYEYFDSYVSPFTRAIGIILLVGALVGLGYLAVKCLSRRRPNQQQEIKEIVNQYVQFYSNKE